MIFLRDSVNRIPVIYCIWHLRHFIGRAFPLSAHRLHPAAKHLLLKYIPVSIPLNSRHTSLIGILPSRPCPPRIIHIRFCHAILGNPERPRRQAGVQNHRGIIGIRIDGRGLIAEFLHAREKCVCNYIHFLLRQPVEILNVHHHPAFAHKPLCHRDKVICLLPRGRCTPRCQIMVKSHGKSGISGICIIPVKKRIHKINPLAGFDIHQFCSCPRHRLKINVTLPLTHIDTIHSCSISALLSAHKRLRAQAQTAHPAVPLLYYM